MMLEKLAYQKRFFVLIPALLNLFLFFPHSASTLEFTSANSFIFPAGIYLEFIITTTLSYPIDELPITATISLSPSTPTPEGISFIYDPDSGTAKLFGIPSMNSLNESPLTFTAINDLQQLMCGPACNNTACYRDCIKQATIIQDFTLYTSHSPCDFTNLNSTKFTSNKDNSFTVEVPQAYPGKITFTGDLPAGVTFHQPPESLSSGLLSGTPVKGTKGCYPVRFTFSGDNGCSSAQDFFLSIDDAKCPPQPVNVTGTQRQASLEHMRAKKTSDEYKDVIRWKAPKKALLAGYGIYSDANLQNYLGSVPSSIRNRYKSTFRFVNPCRTQKYYLASIDEFGRKSTPVKVILKRSKSNCKAFREQKRQFEESSSESSCD